MIMKFTGILLTIISFIMVGSTVLCGLWLKFHSQQPNIAEGINFHMKLALATAGIVLATIVLLLVRFPAK
jgi:hypothetical protein